MCGRGRPGGRQVALSSSVQGVCCVALCRPVSPCVGLCRAVLRFTWRPPPTVLLLLHLGVQVVELEGVFQLLRGDVERLFLQAPCVDLDALGQQLAEAEGLVEEQGSIVQVCVMNTDVWGSS